MTTNVSHLELHFKRPAGTSRGVMQIKNSWIIKLKANNVEGIGEISIIEGLSPDYIDRASFESTINEICARIETVEGNIEQGFKIAATLNDFPSIKFGLETALLDLQNGGKGIIFNNDFTKGIRKLPINGLVWMGDESFMKDQIAEKLADGYSTIKMKVGAIHIQTELSILASIRKAYSSNEITLRVDANGAFSPQQAPELLKKLAELEIHSIEQPIKAGQWEEMAELCHSTPTPIALDEELIGINDIHQKIELLDTIQPQFIILKPSLHGGISGTREWIELAEQKNIPWWMTSALESNIGLSSICQLTAEYQNNLPQGLGTGSLYTNNIECDLIVENGFIRNSKLNSEF
jgi:o-succinylbenzoate synthase